jgi:antitoxin (DNA-binding transcriptional repressor) of toxin-antitoxin stability system
MLSVTIEDAQAHLKELLAGLKPGEEIVITQDQKPVARLIAEGPTLSQPRKLGSMKGSVLYVAPDFDAPLEEFKEYME